MGVVSISDSLNVTIIQQVETSGITYASINKTDKGAYVSPTTATFPASWAVAPSPLPATSVVDFTFFINGQNLSSSSISNFTESGGSSILVIDPNILEFSFDETDVILAVGKFN